MTSRLKRKLNDLGVDPSSSKANESFCLIGTPLPPLEKSRDTGEFVPLWKQDVRDEKGRRRLHGAFTGGFSAGYFNTVGSKEGWAPSTFVSSRTDRAQKKAARAEDFMDEEDLAELRDSRKLVDENEEMDLTGGTQAELRSRADAAEIEKDAMAISLEQALLPTPKDSAGARVLKKMGWRPGQGIGPRLTWRQRKTQELQASTGYSVTQDDIQFDESNEDEEAKRHTYPRRDTPMLLVPRKENSHGLGYVPGLSLNDSLGGGKDPSGSGPHISAGFGLGALNDADDDDVDVYDPGFSSSRSRTAYDEVDNEDHYRTTIGSRKAMTRKGPTNARSTPGTIQTFSDGRIVIAGFVLSDKPVIEDKWFPLPDIPSGWKPDPRRVWKQDKSDKENAKSPDHHEPSVSSSWRNNMSADQRGDVLGETPISSKPRSVFDYISQKDRDRLKSFVPPVSRANVSSPGSTVPPPIPPQPPLESVFSFTYPRIEPFVAKAALSGFKPFTSDPVKQARYTAYLQSQSQSQDGEQRHLKQKPGQTLEHLQKELEEYAQAAIVFKPLSGAMAGRFTTATIVDTAPQAVEGLHTPLQDAPKADPVPESKVEEEKEENAKTHAVKTGMYGSLTREVIIWLPVKLLCKRFGVKEPEIEQSQEEAAKPSKGGASSWEPESNAAEAELVSVGTSSSTKDLPSIGGSAGRRDLANIGMGEDETQGTDILTYERPGRDIFKAIFASDDEDSDSDDEEGRDKDEEKDRPPPPISAEASTKSETPRKAVPDVVDMSSFKPVFIPRSERDGDHSTTSKKRKRDKEKKKKGEKILVSFEVEEDDSTTAPVTKERSRKKKPKHIKEDGEDDSAWVEKPVPDVVHALSAVSMENQAVDSTTKLKQEGPVKGRKRAVDFM